MAHVGSRNVVWNQFIGMEMEWLGNICGLDWDESEWNIATAEVHLFLGLIYHPLGYVGDGDVA